ncbi:fatty acid desaturase family protein [Mesorhizobium sp. PL10]
MPVEVTRRDYSLIGRDTRAAIESGLSAATWYACPISRKDLKELMKRTDGPAIRDTIIWLSLLFVSGVLGFFAWGTLWAVPCFVVYGVLYGSASDSRWHECGHGTAFKTRWMNDVVYHIASFMLLHEPTVWKWSHTRHHTDTIIVGRDPEIAVPRPPDVFGILLDTLVLKRGFAAFKNLLLHAAGRLTEGEKTFIPEMEQWKVYLVARIYVAIYFAVIAACVYTNSILPAMYVGLPSFYGGFFTLFFGLTQHAGLSEDVLDHRLNSRTVYMNPVFRFIYWNMNYHVEHHMFPMVPYHALPRLHEAVKVDCPPAYTSCFVAYKEIIPAIWRQVKDPTYFVKRELPSGAKPVPYNHGTQIIAG